MYLYVYSPPSGSPILSLKITNKRSNSLLSPEYTRSSRNSTTNHPFIHFHRTQNEHGRPSTPQATPFTQIKRKPDLPSFLFFAGPRRLNAGPTRRPIRPAWTRTRRPPRRASRSPTNARQTQARGDPRSSQVRQRAHPSQVHWRS